MKPEMKIEGDVLKFTVAQSIVVDTDKDGQASLRGSVGVNIEIDGSEVLAELLKSSSLAQKAKGLLEQLGLVKAEG